LSHDRQADTRTKEKTKKGSNCDALQLEVATFVLGGFFAKFVLCAQAAIIEYDIRLLKADTTQLCSTSNK